MNEELADQKNSAPVEIFPSIVNTNNNNLDKNTYFIGSWEEADPFLQDNAYVKRGYRINFNTVKRIFRSLFMCHNETTNIWSHLLAAMLFAGLIVYIFFCLVPGNILKGQSLNVIAGSQNGSVTLSNDTSYKGTVLIYTKDNETMGYVDEIVESLSSYVRSLK